ncbi:MAG TPA: hypothetical protein VNH18_18830, partial [Bryobacteraceae bacterium]|nr:hypothetical protein [Bryobacteraceae bacterium]
YRLHPSLLDGALLPRAVADLNSQCVLATQETQPTPNQNKPLTQILPKNSSALMDDTADCT